MPLTRDHKKRAAELLNLLDLLKRHVEKHIRPPFDLNAGEINLWHQRVDQAEEYLLGAQNLVHEICVEPRDLLDFLIDIESFADIHALAPEPEAEAAEELTETDQAGAEAEASGEAADGGDGDVAGEGDDVEPELPAEDQEQSAEQEASATEQDSDDALNENDESDEEAEEEHDDPQERFEQMRRELIPVLTASIQRLGEWVREERDEHFR